MKKIFFFLAALMFGFAAHATVVECSPNTNAISWWLTQGDTLVLADGEYVEDYSITFDKPGVCVKAAEGAKPVIKLTGEWTDFKVTATTTFDGITFDGGNVAKYFLATTGAESGTLTVTNCEFKNWTYWAISNQFKEDASIDSVIIDNCFFHDGLGAAVRFSEKAAEGKHACNYLKVTNSTFYNIVSTEYAAIIQANSNGEATGEQNEIIIDHITLYNFDASQLGAIAMRKSSKLSITNSIIATPENKDQYAFYIYGGNVENTLYFNGKAKSGPTYTNCIEGKDPLFVDAANGNFALAEGSPALGAATDGSNLGDPRWTPAEPEIEWVPMELEITNLTTEGMEVEGAKYLQLKGRDDMNDADVVLFLNNYTGENKAYEVNAESSYMTFGGLELAVLEGSMTKAVDTEKGDVYTGVVKASVTDEEEGGTMYIAFDLTMYALPAEELVITNATVTIDENLGTLTFKTTLDDGDYMVELSGYTAPGVHEGPQICLLETPAAVAFGNHAETVVADGVITLTCKGMASFMGAKFDLTISGKLPVAEPEPVEPLVKLTGDEDIYHFYLSQGVAVNTNPASPYYGYTYVTAATDGAADGGSDRADTQKRGIFVYDKELACLNPSNAGFLPANATALMTDVSRQAMHRIAINPVNDHVAFCYNVAGASAVWSMDPANLAGDATNLIEGLAITAANAICFDEKGTLYVMDNANTSTGGTIVKVVNGELVTVAQHATWGVQDNSLASDGRGGLWVAQNRWNIDAYSILTHVNAAGEIDFKVTKDSPEEVKALFTQVANASYRGQCAYDAENHVLAFGGDKVVSLFKVYYDVITGVPSLEKLISTPAIGSNIDGVAFYDNGDFAVVSASAERFVKFACNIEIPVQPDLNGIVKRAVTVGETVVVLTHEADGTAHIYALNGEAISEVSQEGVIARDPENAGDLLAISDIAVTEDGKLVAVNQMICQADSSYVDTGYKRGENRFYIWNTLNEDPTIWFKSIQYANWFRSSNGYTMAIKGTSTNATIALSGYHATKSWARIANYKVIDGVYIEPANSAAGNEHYTWCEGTAAGDIDDNVIGKNYELNASPLAAENWIIDGDLVNPVEYTTPAEIKAVLATVTPLSTDLGKKFNGATYLKDGANVWMVAPYANAEGLLAGVKVLDLTAGFASDSVIAVIDLETPVAATAAATAVSIAAYDINITLVADGFIYNLAGKLPKPAPEVATVLNPFAYNLSSTLSEDSTALTVNYTLNANAEAVEIVILNGEEVLKTVPCKGINKGTYTVNIPTAGLPEAVALTWSVNVKGIAPAAPVENPVNYSLYHPSAVDIDNNPENATFGLILTNEGMHSVKAKTEGYISAGFGAGIFAFNPDFTPIKNDTLPGFNGGIEFTNGRADSESATAYSPRRIRISDDGRIFVTSLNTNGTYLWEVNPENMNEWTPVFQGDTMNANAELLTADSAFIAAPNNGFDVKGAGENLQLMMYSVNLPGITGAAMSGFRCDEYNLGTATTWATAPSKNWVLGKYAINYTGTQVVYDNEGGIWIASYRGTANDANPGLVHINKDGVEDAKLIWSNVRQAGIRFNNDFTKLVVAGNNGAAKKATVYTISKDSVGAPVLTEALVINMATVGNNLNDFAWDYAGNLYSCGNSAEKIVSWAMPYSGKVSTPAASKYAFKLEAAETPAPSITLTATGLETTLEADGSYTLQGQAVVDGDESKTMDFMLCVYPTEGYTDAFLNGWSVMIFNAPTPGAFVENEDGTFTYTAQIEDTNDGTVYNINMSGTIKKTEGPVYMDMEDQITNMTFDTDNMEITGGPSENYSIKVVLKLGEDNFDGSYTLSSESSVTIRDLAAEFVEGYVYDIDLSAPSAKAVVKVNWDGMYYAFTLTMSAAKPEAIVIDIDDANVEVIKVPLFDDVYDYSLKMTADYTHTDGVTYPVLLEVPLYYPEATEPSTIMCTLTVGGEGDDDPWLGFGEGELTITTVESVVTAKGLVSNPGTGDAFDVTISGKLPETAVDNIQMGVKATKVIKNGQLIIINNDVEYNAQGAVVK